MTMQSERRSAYIAALVYLVLMAIGIPWYWPQDDTSIWFGVPAWVAIAVATSFCASVFTALRYIKRWPEPEDPGNAQAEQDSTGS